MERYRIGRSHSCDILIEGRKVSRRHAEIVVNDDGTAELLDLDSTNGSFVNGERIAEPRRLKPGDSVTLGDTPFDWEEQLKRLASHRPKRTSAWRWIVPLVAAAALIAAGWATYHFFSPTELSGEQIFDRYSSAVVMVITDTGYEATVDGRPLGEIDPALADLNYTSFDLNDDVVVGHATKSGSGFFVDKQGRIITSRHLLQPFDVAARQRRVKDAIIDEVCDRYGIPSIAQLTLMGEMTGGVVKKLESIEVKYRLLSIRVALGGTIGSDRRNLLPCSLVASSDDEELDLAAIVVNGKKTPERVVTPIAISGAVPDGELTIGSGIYAVAFEKNSVAVGIPLEAALFSGAVTQPCGSREYGHNIALPPAATGAPLFDRFGRFAGMVVAGAEAAHSRAICPSEVAAFLR